MLYIKTIKGSIVRLDTETSIYAGEDVSPRVYTSGYQTARISLFVGSLEECEAVMSHITAAIAMGDRILDLAVALER